MTAGKVVVLRCLTLLLGLALLVLLALLPAKQAALLEEAYRGEVLAVQEVAGAILSVYPELEREIADLLSTDSGEYAAYGEAVLSKYGYSVERPHQADPRYRRLLEELRRDRWLAAGFAVGAVALLYLGWWLGHRLHTDRLSVMLDAYLARDYSASVAQYRDKKGRGGATGRIQEQLRQLGGQIRIGEARLGEEKESTKALVTDVSHQLKTPIAALKMCLELCVEAEDESERAEFLNRSRMQLDKLEALTGTLMNISRLETAMITLRPGPVSLEAVLLDGVNAVYAGAVRKEIILDMDEFDDLTLHLDRKWTAEALANILDNAVKYSPAESEIHIRVQKRISFVRVEIDDAGIGVPRGEQNRIFQRFYRGDSELVRTAEGAGVGLYLTRLILERQGGSVHVRSGSRAGSTFVVQLPLRSVSKP